jgi:hypothetical protein
MMGRRSDAGWLDHPVTIARSIRYAAAIRPLQPVAERKSNDGICDERGHPPAFQRRKIAKERGPPLRDSRKYFFVYRRVELWSRLADC